jgi:hypothetical protein
MDYGGGPGGDFVLGKPDDCGCLIETMVKEIML